MIILIFVGLNLFVNKGDIGEYGLEFKEKLAFVKPVLKFDDEDDLL